MKILKRLTIEEIQDLANNVFSSAEMCRKLNLCDSGGNATRLRKLIRPIGQDNCGPKIKQH